MIKKLLKSILTVMLSTFFLVVVAVVIRLFIKNPQTSLEDILFYVGAAPIAFFSIGFFGDRLGKGSISYQLSRSVSKQTPNQRAQKDEEDNRSRFLFSIHWIFAGLLVWLFSYFL